jgi:hypothetical protein
MVHTLPLHALALPSTSSTALNMADMDGFEPAPPSSFDWGSDDEGDEGSGDGSDSLTVPSFTAAKGGSFVVPACRPLKGFGLHGLSLSHYAVH